MKMNKCKRCGHKLDDNWKCCPICGRFISGEHHTIFDLFIIMMPITLLLTLLIIYSIAFEGKIPVYIIVLNVITLIFLIILYIFRLLKYNSKLLNRIIPICTWIIVFFDIVVAIAIFKPVSELIIDGIISI